MTKKNKAVALFLSFIILAAVAVSLFFITAESAHSCISDACPICMQIKSCMHIVKLITGKTAFQAHLFIIAIYSAAILITAIKNTACNTPIALKVKLTY